MKTLGMLGGMAWPSTADAYRRINEAVGEHLGGVTSAPLIVWSFDFAQVERLQSAGDWDAAGSLLADAARRLEDAGAEGLMLCTNTMHLVAPFIEDAVDIPLLHIADATAKAVRSAGVERVGLLGTRFTMEHVFYAGRLREHGLDVVVPGKEDRDDVHRIIYEELVLGKITDDARRTYREVSERLVEDGAQGIIAGCTEIELLLGPADVPVPYFPTTAIHVDAAVDWILGV
jgi:aspartate racemase